jgi:hypothetical protein
LGLNFEPTTILTALVLRNLETSNVLFDRLQHFGSEF